MNKSRFSRRSALAGAGVVLAMTLSACGNVTNASQANTGADFPKGPVTLTVGQAPGGSTDLIGRAVAENAADALGTSIPVVNKPGANGALATKEVAAAKPDGQNLVLLNASLITITPLAVKEDQAVKLDDLDVITGISQDDYVLVSNAASGLKTMADLKNSGKKFNFGTTGVGTGSQLAQALLFKQADISGTDVPFDGGSPALTALLGNQVDLTTVQLGEAMPQIKAGKVTPIVVFSTARNKFLADTPTAVEAGYDVAVSQYRAIAAPKGTPEPVKAKLRDAFKAAFSKDAYKKFNEQNLFTPTEIDGAQLATDWSGYADKYKALTQKYAIDLRSGK
ncbi:MAG TPA: tripartite tricarboxylate transporter substrate binding protein [Arthrobacter sp.]|nr:tripartite tricarboxylate transporter substrate binding protein [Arthrobacter sp.]